MMMNNNLGFQPNNPFMTGSATNSMGGLAATNNSGFNPMLPNNFGGNPMGGVGGGYSQFGTNANAFGTNNMMNP